MKRKFTALLTLFCFLCAAGCSSTTETADTVAIATTTTVKTTASATTTAQTTTTTTSHVTTSAASAKTEITTESTTITEITVEENSEKEQMVIDIARRGYTAISEKDYENVLEYVNFSAGYFLTNGEWVSDERVIEQVIEATGEDDNNMFTWFAAMENMEFLGTQHLTPEELQEYNDFIPQMAASEDVNYSFTDAYKVFVDYPAMSQSEKDLIGTEDAVHLLVVEADGEWKLDLFVSTFKEIMDSIYEMEN